MSGGRHGGWGRAKRTVSVNSMDRDQGTDMKAKEGATMSVKKEQN